MISYTLEHVKEVYYNSTLDPGYKNRIKQETSKMMSWDI